MNNRERILIGLLFVGFTQNSVAVGLSVNAAKKLAKKRCVLAVGLVWPAISDNTRKLYRLGSDAALGNLYDDNGQIDVFCVGDVVTPDERSGCAAGILDLTTDEFHVYVPKQERFGGSFLEGKACTEKIVRSLMFDFVDVPDRRSFGCKWPGIWEHYECTKKGMKIGGKDPLFQKVLANKFKIGVPIDLPEYKER